MLFFFRKLRKSLLGSTNLKTYLLYGIGEIVLVVVGILIAFQLEELREADQRRRQEQQILAQLHADFLQNKAEFEKTKAGHEEVRDMVQWLMNEAPFDDLSKVDTVKRYLGRSFNHHTYDPTSASIDALTNTASFDLISDDTLRSQITRWKDMVGDLNEDEYFIRDKVKDRTLDYFIPRIAIAKLFGPDTPDFSKVEADPCNNVLIERWVTENGVIYEMETMEPVLEDILKRTGGEE